MFERVVIVDCSSHLVGRLASILAKELLNGQKIVLTRCEEANISGSLFRNKLIFSKFLQKRNNTNPWRGGPIHYRTPSRMIWRVIRGMLPHKTKRGAAALKRLKVMDGVPHPYDRMKRMVIPGALRLLRLKPGRKYCRLGDLASSVGWTHNDLIKRLEEKRKKRSAVYYARKKQITALKAKAIRTLSDKLSALPKVSRAAIFKKKKDGEGGQGAPQGDKAPKVKKEPKDDKEKKGKKETKEKPDKKEKPKKEKPKKEGEDDKDKKDKVKKEKVKKETGDKGDKAAKSKKEPKAKDQEELD